jgi:hypothetical protein
VPALVPDYRHVVLTGGFGDIQDSTYAAAASSESAVVAYTPEARELTFDFTSLGPVDARWIHAEDGSETPLGELSGSSVVLAPPGGGDWVFLARRAAGLACVEPVELGCPSSTSLSVQLFDAPGSGSPLEASSGCPGPVSASRTDAHGTQTGEVGFDPSTLDLQHTVGDLRSDAHPFVWSIADVQFEGTCDVAVRPTVAFAGADQTWNASLTIQEASTGAVVGRWFSGDIIDPADQQFVDDFAPPPLEDFLLGVSPGETYVLGAQLKTVRSQTNAENQIGDYTVSVMVAPEPRAELMALAAFYAVYGLAARRWRSARP